jgi:DNA-directed RNA polymerase beta subunit
MASRMGANRCVQFEEERREDLMMLTPETVALRERVDFSKIKTTIPIPNLIEVQKKSYERFL